MKLRRLNAEEETLFLAKIKAGEVKQVHLGTIHSIFRPRGSMKKNSLGDYLLDKLQGEYEYWTDPKYADNPEVEELVSTMFNNMMGEVLAAWETFIREGDIQL